jgi:predicted nucleotidyltransferase
VKPPPNVLLSGIVGSTAYGLAHEGSDIDRLGVFAAPTVALLGLSKPAESVVSSKPDATFHEAGKMASLLLKCNPAVTELIWLPEDLYEVRTPLGDGLRRIRHCFLSRKYTRDAFLGYATSQFGRLENRGDGSFSADTRKRTSKHARHLARLVWQGAELYRDGVLRVRLEDPERFRDFGERVAAGDLDIARRELARAAERFGSIDSPLPEHPDREAAEAWLLGVRRAFWDLP